MVSVVSDNRDSLSIVASEHANDQWLPLWLKGDAIADSELQHLGMRSHLMKEAKALDDTIVQVDEFRISQLIDVNFHWCAPWG